MVDTALSEATDKQINQAKQEIFDYVNAMLGGGMIDVELDPIHYETALTKALGRFRQRSDNSVEGLGTT